MKSSKINFFIFLFLNFYFVSCDLDEGETCTLKANSSFYNGLPGMCMHFNECQKIKQLWKDKAITRDQLTICSRAKKIICCPTEERISQKKCKEYGEKVFRITKIGSLIGQQPHEIRRSMCTHKSISLIIGGTEAENHEFPHQALLGYATENTEVKWLCGGSLVSPNFVLTAAHCLFSRQIGHVQKVKVGMKYKDQEDDNRNVFIYNIKETFKHQNYNEQTFNEDIALLKLDGTVPINENILPICLPTKQHDDFKAIATGFGRTQTYGQQSEVLLKVALESFTHSECKESYPDDGIVQIDEETMLCFGHHSQRMDICRGDSGGPLQISNDNNVHCTYTQIGIASFGPSRCGTINLPSSFTNVFNYHNWIEGIVWDNEV